MRSLVPLKTKTANLNQQGPKASVTEREMRYATGKEKRCEGRKRTFFFFSVKLCNVSAELGILFVLTIKLCYQIWKGN